MNETQVIVVQAETCRLAPSSQLGKLTKKYCWFPSYVPGPTGVEGMPGVIVTTPDNIAGAMTAASGAPSLLTVPLVESGFAEGLAAVVDACDRHSFLLVSAQNGLLLAGSAANKETPEQDRPCSSADVIPTLCYMFGFPVPANTTGAILYQGLKSPDMPHDEIRRLQDAVAHLEAALERDNRNPWDKHDCA